MLKHRPCFGIAIGYDFFKSIFAKIGEQQSKKFNLDKKKQEKSDEGGSLKIEKMISSDTKILNDSISN